MLRITCAAALLASTGAASAQGIELFGEARLGLGYNIDNDGGAIPEGESGHDKLRAVSRVRFGVLMTGQTDSGITYGAELEAHDAIEGNGGGTDGLGQNAGEVFVSGSLGTLTFGDTDGADYHHVGDLNEVGLTCLGCENETPFISNGGGFGEDELNFADNPFARPTVRYDYEFASGGVSLSTNRDLNDIGVGASWTADIAGGEITVGAGYYDYSAFTDFLEDDDPLSADTVEVSAGRQWSAALGGEFEGYNAKVIYTSADSEGDASFETLGAGLGAAIGVWGVNFYYNSIIDASGVLRANDGDDSIGFGVNYDLGGGVLAQFGIADTYADDAVSDFGIFMTF